MENSIEEDIKDLKKYISFSKKHENFSHDADWKWHKEIGEKIERVLKENEVLLKENEKYYKQLDLDYTENNFISKQKVKDNLIKYQEEYELLLEHQSGKESNRTKYLRGRIHMCQELLEGRK